MGIFARGSVSTKSSWTATSWGRGSGLWDRGLAVGRHLFWGWGSNGCRSLTHSGLEGLFYGAFFQVSHHLRVQDVCILALNKGGDHVAEVRGSSSELQWANSFYYPHNPIGHHGDGLPGLGLRDKRLDCFEQFVAMWGRATHVVWKRKSTLFLRMFVFYYIRYSSGKLFECLYGPSKCEKHIALGTRNWTDEWMNDAFV